MHKARQALSNIYLTDRNELVDDSINGNAGRAHWNSAGNTIYINKVYGYYSVALGPSPIGTH